MRAGIRLLDVCKKVNSPPGKGGQQQDDNWRVVYMELLRNGYNWQSNNKAPLRIIYELTEQLNREKIRDYKNGQR